VRKLFWQMMVSLDGFMEGPNRELDWHVVDDEFQQYALEMLRSIDAMLLGRTTYQLFADYWPSATEPGAEELNALEKVVFSTTLNDVDWKNSRLVSQNVVDEITRLKQQEGKDLAIFGSSTLVSSLPLGLIDEYRIMVCPIVLGAGTPVLPHRGSRLPLNLVSIKQFGSGIVFLRYQPGISAQRVDFEVPGSSPQ